ncbi:MAG: hypothetical protein AB1746_03035 [Candidatus Zixiibacteriota bacterium]
MKEKAAMFIHTSVFSITLSLVFIMVSVGAEVPGTMSYQGILTNSSGNPVPDGSHNVLFIIYDEADSVRWEESHTINTINGLFSVQLGSNGSPLTADVFNHTECWLGITVEGDPEITPRTQLNTVPYAFKTGDIQSGDILNESGVAAFSGAYYVYLEDLAYTILCSLAVTCPAAGYVMAVAHGRIATLPQHTVGTKSYAVVGISDTPNSLPGNQDLDFQIDSGIPTGVYSIPFGMTSMFEIPASGTYTYYYLAFEYSGSISVADMQFNLVYFPTAYGSVDPVPPPVKSPDNDFNLTDSVKKATTSTDKVVPGTMDVTQLERELAALRARIDVIQQQIDSAGAQEH